MITGIDHVVIMVSDLESGARKWEAAGFQVVSGGRHPRGTHNALVAFEDGSYLELIAFWEPDYDAHKWHRFKDSGIGLIDHALASSNLALEVPRVTSAGIPYDGPNPGARSRPDGIELEWRTAQPAVGDNHDLPFLIDDITDRELRVPAGDQARHRNGAMGIDTLQLVVADLSATSPAYARVTESTPASNDSGSSVGQTSTSIAVMVGPHRVEIHQPDGAGKASSRLTDYGAGPYAVRFYGQNSFEIDPGELDGARVSAIKR